MRIIVPKIDIPLFLVCFFTIFFPTVFHPDSVRWSTMLFTCTYCVFFMIFARLVKNSDINAREFYRLVRLLVYAYAIVLIIQQLCVLLELPVFMKAQYVYPQLPYKLNSLSAEPSHTTILLSVIMFFYALTRTHEEKGIAIWKDWISNKWLWGGYLWVIFSTFNTSAFIFSTLSVIPFINKRNILPIAGIFGVIAIILLGTPINRYTHTERLTRIAKAVVTLDEDSIIEADPSAAFRIVPTLRGARLVDFRKINNYIGYGTDADKSDTAPRPADLYHDWGFAGIFSMWHNYGMLCALAFWTAIFMVTYIRRDWLSTLSFIVAIILSAEYNMQLVWQIMAFSLVYKYSICKNTKLLAA